MISSLFYYILFLGAFLPRLNVILYIGNIDINPRLLTKLVWLFGLLGIIIFSIIKERKTFLNKILLFIKEYKCIVFSFVVVLISAIGGIFTGINSKNSFLGLLFYTSLFVSFFFILTSRNKKQINKIFLRSLIISIITNFIVSVFQVIVFFLYQYDTTLYQWFNGPGFVDLQFFKIKMLNLLILRPSGLMPDPNFLAAFYIFSFWILENFKLERKWKKLLQIILAVGIFISFSKSGIFVFFVSVIGYYLYTFFIIKKKNLPAFFTLSKHDLLRESSERLFLFKEALVAWREFPIFGLGIGNYGKFYSERNGYWFTAHPHNEYLRFLAELGVIGFLGFLFFNLFVLYRLFRYRRVYSIIIIISLLLLSITYDYYMSPWVWAFLSMILLNENIT